MTAQVTEILIYCGNTHQMCTCPSLTAAGHEGLRFRSALTCNWRGYVGTWEIVGNRLYLRSVQGELVDGTQASLEQLHPEAQGKVFAHWVSSELRVPIGPQVHYVHMGFESRWATELYLAVDRGIIVGQRAAQYTAADAERNAREARDAGRRRGIPAFLLRGLD